MHAAAADITKRRRKNMDQLRKIIQQNTECLLTLAGVVLYELLEPVLRTLGIGWSAALFGIALTAAGVILTLISGKDLKMKGISLAIHLALWILKGLIGLVATVIIILYIFNRISRPKTTEIRNVSDLPNTLRQGDRVYRRDTLAAGCALYTNSMNPADCVRISAVFRYDSFTNTVDTDAGTFSLL